MLNLRVRHLRHIEANRDTPTSNSFIPAHDGVIYLGMLRYFPGARRLRHLHRREITGGWQRPLRLIAAHSRCSSC